MEKYPIHNPRVTRRGFLGGAGSAAVVGLMASEGLRYDGEDEEEGVEVVFAEELDTEVEEIESAEIIPEDLPSPNFEEVLTARTIEAGGLRRDQVLFVDSLGRQITEPVNLTEAVGLSPEDMTWRFEGGGPAGIPGAWTKEMRAHVSELAGIPPSEISMLHVYQDLDNSDQEYFNSRVEMVYHNATTEVQFDGKGRDALTIIRDEANFKYIPKDLAEYLLPQLIGIAAEESRFDAKKTSPAGAVGFIQTMPEVFEKYKQQHNKPDLNPRNLLDQLPVGLQHIETSYLELVNDLDLELVQITQDYFKGNAALMERYFLIPLIINSYNAGQARMTEVVKWFLQNYPEPESTTELLGDTGEYETLSGYDVFFAMVHNCAQEKGVSRFGPEASTYVSKVMGWTRAFSDYEAKQKPQRLASNY